MNMTPIEPSKLRSLLNEGTVQFAFKKINGDLRTAVGTTALESIPVESHPNGNGSSPASVVTFFDISKSEWRSVSTSREIFLAD